MKTSPKRSYSVIENERFGLVFVKTLSIISGTAWILNDIGRNSLLRNRKKIAKFLMRTFTCRYLPLWEEPNKDEDSFLHMQLGINVAIFIFSNTKHFLWCSPNRERRSARIEGRYLSFFISTAKSHKSIHRQLRNAFMAIMRHVYKLYFISRWYKK